MRLKWTLPGAAALLLGCGGDTTPTKSTAKPAAAETKTTPASPPSKPVDTTKKPIADVPEPPPPKAVSEKNKNPEDKPEAPPKLPPVRTSTPAGAGNSKG